MLYFNMLYEYKIALKFFGCCAEAITSPSCGKKLYQATGAFDKRNFCFDISLDSEVESKILRHHLE